MKLWVDIYDYYLNDVPACSYLTAASALRMAAQEFCEDAKVWRATLTNVPTVAGTSTYSFPITAEQEVSKVLEVRLADQLIGILLHEDAGGEKSGLINLDQRQFLLQPTPAAVQQVSIKVVLRPSNISTGIDDALYAFHAEAIAQGAKARLFGMANQPFTNPSAAITARDRFEYLMAKAKIKTARAYSSAPIRTRPSFM
jgi:hypothetical protein